MSQNLWLRVAGRSDVGLVRENNEDSGFIGKNIILVADGMGGHAAGELASSTAVAVAARFDNLYTNNK
jgi:protein phosphatase